MTDEIQDDGNGAPPPPRSKVVSVTEYVRPLFQAAFEQFGRGEHIVFEVAIEALPGPPLPDAPINPQTGQPDPNWESMLIVYAEIQGIVPNTRILRSWSLMPHAWDQEKANQAVSQMIVPQMLEGRRQQLQAMQEQANNAMANGETPPTHGLILPGGR